MDVESKKSRWMINLVLALASIVWLFPIFVMFKESLRVNGFDNYIATLQNPNFPTFVFNSFFVAFFMIIISITILRSQRSRSRSLSLLENVSCSTWSLLDLCYLLLR